MGKSVVLKDLEHRPQGYVRADCDSVICRVKLDAPAQLAVLLISGEIRQYTIAGSQEQRFSCDGTQLRGCFVHREGRLLLISDETMQGEFARYALRRQKEANLILQPDQSKENRQTEKKEEKKKEFPEERKIELPSKEDIEKALLQRRWPPPPCWETACYRDGCWQERACF